MGSYRILRMQIAAIWLFRAHVSGCSQPFVSCSVQFTVILYLLFAFLFPNKTILNLVYNACNTSKFISKANGVYKRNYSFSMKHYGSKLYE